MILFNVLQQNKKRKTNISFEVKNYFVKRNFEGND